MRSNFVWLFSLALITQTDGSLSGIAVFINLSGKNLKVLRTSKPYIWSQIIIFSFLSCKTEKSNACFKNKRFQPLSTAGNKEMNSLLKYCYHMLSITFYLFFVVVTVMYSPLLYNNGEENVIDNNIYSLEIIYIF